MSSGESLLVPGGSLGGPGLVLVEFIGPGIDLAAYTLSRGGDCRHLLFVYSFGDIPDYIHRISFHLEFVISHLS